MDICYENQETQHELKTNHPHKRAEPFWGNSVRNHSFETPKPSLPITFQFQGSAASPFHRLSAAQGTVTEKVRVTPRCRQVTPTTLETQQASWRQTLSRWVTTVRFWTPTVPSQAWEKYSLKITKTNNGEEDVGGCLMKSSSHKSPHFILGLNVPFYLFSSGRKQRTVVICVSQGLWDNLARIQMKAVHTAGVWITTY